MFPRYIRNIFMLCGLFCLSSCKDPKNWESSYDCKVEIKFEPEMDPLVPEAPKDLNSIILQQQFPYLLQKVIKCLMPNENEIVVQQPGILPEEHQFAIVYERVVSLISPEAGGLQVKYIIKDIRFGTTQCKKTIFKKFKIENSVPLTIKNGVQAKQDVTIFY